MPYKTYAPQILAEIRKANHPLIISHENPDGDTLGASLAMANFLTNQEQKKHKHYCKDKPAEYFNFLPKIENISNDYQSINWADHDLVIALDCGDLKRTSLGEDLQKHKNDLVIINIDHHFSNDLFGHYNLVVPQASSTSEIVYKFFEFHKIEIDKYIATNLLTGILTDTMNFTNAATNEESLEIASQLLNKGARIHQIINQVGHNKNLGALKLWGKALARLEYNAQENFAYTVITKDDLAENNLTPEATEGLANFLSNLQDVDYIMVLTETEDNFINGNLRTTKNEIDVSKIAAKLGGGGHKKASGFKIEGQLIQTASGWQIK